jgi:hypothetical protein
MSARIIAALYFFKSLNNRKGSIQYMGHHLIPNPIILASGLGLGLQINLEICGFYEGLTYIAQGGNNRKKI